MWHAAGPSSITIMQGQANHSPPTKMGAGSSSQRSKLSTGGEHSNVASGAVPRNHLVDGYPQLHFVPLKAPAALLRRGILQWKPTKLLQSGPLLGPQVPQRTPAWMALRHGRLLLLQQGAFLLSSRRPSLTSTLLPALGTAVKRLNSVTCNACQASRHTAAHTTRGWQEGAFTPSQQQGLCARVQGAHGVGRAT